MLNFITSGESHGQALIAVLEGIPAGLTINVEDINADLARRQQGYGRGQRMNIETDKVNILSGIRHKYAMSSPITLMIKNKDWENWTEIMSPTELAKKDSSLNRPRPGHADLAGLMKYGSSDFRDILERASARETAARVAVGAVCKALLKEFGINIYSYVEQIGSVSAKISNINKSKIQALAEKSVLRCPDKSATEKMIQLIKKTTAKGDTLGGKFRVVAENIPVGLGSHTQWNRKFDGRLAQSLMSIQAIKAVEVGIGTEFAKVLGSDAHDEIFYSGKKGFYRLTNRAGGTEGGMTNGENIEVSCTMKPIPSLVKPLKSVNIKTKKTEKAEAVRSDVCAVSAAGVVGEAAVAYELANAMIEKFGGDCIKDMKANYKNYISRIQKI